MVSVNGIDIFHLRFAVFGDVWRACQYSKWVRYPRVPMHSRSAIHFSVTLVSARSPAIPPHNATRPGAHSFAPAIPCVAFAATPRCPVAPIYDVINSARIFHAQLASHGARWRSGKNMSLPLTDTFSTPSYLLGRRTEIGGRKSEVGRSIGAGCLVIDCGSE